MPPQCRVGDFSAAPKDVHHCPTCVHATIGKATVGSPDVNVNGMPALRVTDTGVHSKPTGDVKWSGPYTCCGPNTWVATKGSATVFINNLAAHRVGDDDKHCGGPGKMVNGSKNVTTGG